MGLLMGLARFRVTMGSGLTLATLCLVGACGDAPTPHPPQFYRGTGGAGSTEIPPIDDPGSGGMGGGVGNPSDLPNCADNGLSLYMEGDDGSTVDVDRDRIHPGSELVTVARWYGEPLYVADPIEEAVFFEIEPNPVVQTFSWYLEFTSPVVGEPLEAKLYEDAVRPGDALDGEPGLYFYSGVAGCTSACGKFQIHDVVWADDQVQLFSVGFEQYCNCGTAKVRGCFYFQRP
jgi:hypothetical protein